MFSTSTFLLLFLSLHHSPLIALSFLGFVAVSACGIRFFLHAYQAHFVAFNNGIRFGFAFCLTIIYQY